jgi:hypothetical protein
LQQQFAQFGLGQGQFNNNNDLMLAYRQQQLMAMQSMGNPQAAAAAMMIGEEHKPFKCPVIGCEKAYKNQNGLKYVFESRNLQKDANISSDTTRHTATKPNSYMTMLMARSRL